MRVVLVPGFTQTAASWDGIVPLVPDAVALDVPVQLSFVDTAAAIGAAGGEALYVGYSMGGRLCLRLALDQPELVAGLVLVSASPGIQDSAERRARMTADEALAREVVRDGVDAFLARWLAQPMFSGVHADAPGVADRSRLSPEYLAACLRILGAGAMEPLWNRLGELRMPLALVTGTRDVKYDAIAERMIEHIATGVFHLRLESGHALPQEQPAELGAFIAAFAAEHG